MDTILSRSSLLYTIVSSSPWISSGKPVIHCLLRMQQRFFSEFLLGTCCDFGHLPCPHRPDKMSLSWVARFISYTSFYSSFLILLHFCVSISILRTDGPIHIASTRYLLIVGCIILLVSQKWSCDWHRIARFDLIGRVARPGLFLLYHTSCENSIIQGGYGMNKTVLNVDPWVHHLRCARFNYCPIVSTRWRRSVTELTLTRSYALETMIGWYSHLQRFAVSNLYIFYINNCYVQTRNWL